MSKTIPKPAQNNTLDDYKPHDLQQMKGEKICAGNCVPFGQQRSEWWKDSLQGGVFKLNKSTMYIFQQFFLTF